MLQQCEIAVTSGSQTIRPNRGEIVVFDHIDQALQHTEEHLLAVSSLRFDKGFRLQLAGEHVSEADFEALIQHMRRTSHDAGEVILHAGDTADELLLLESGSVAVARSTPSGSYERLLEMGSGAVIGDIGYVLGQQRSADVIALETSITLRIIELRSKHLSRPTHPWRRRSFES